MVKLVLPVKSICFFPFLDPLSVISGRLLGKEDWIHSDRCGSVYQRLVCLSIYGGLDCYSGNAKAETARLLRERWIRVGSFWVSFLCSSFLQSLP